MANEIDARLQEHRSFPPPDAFRRNANANDEKDYDVKDRQAFWAGWTAELDWQTKWDKVLEWETRSGKIMRRLLRDIAEGRTLGDVTTLAGPTVVAEGQVRGGVVRLRSRGLEVARSRGV